MPTTTTLAESRASRMLREILQSGRPLTYVRTSEEQRAGNLLREAGQRLTAAGVPVWSWSLTSGLRRDGGTTEAGTHDPRGVLDFIVAHTEAAIFHLMDFHEPLRESMEIRRRMRDVHQSLQGQGKYVVITSPVRAIPEELERSLLYVDLRPPDLVELTAFLRTESGSTDDALIYRLAPALLGLTLDEARYAVRRALAAGGRLSAESLPALLEEKRLLINRSGVIEFIAEGAEIGDVGGLDGLKSWLLERRKLFELRDDLNSEIVPKGLLLMGIAGCGKSLAVKAISSHFGLPLYRVDMTEIFSGRHGKPESAFVEACRLVEELVPAVLWFDEIEMGVTSADGGGEQGRLFAFFLTWMQEKARGLFVAATANRIDLLPAEMIRKGRFDEVFFVDLPTAEERLEIFRIHLTRRGVDLAGIELSQLTEFTNEWSGAEVEQCVVSALTKASLTGKAITGQDLIQAAVRIVPLAITMHEQINHIRGWAFERAVRASKRER
ncbi:MAG: AAA family ATPase [Candidatus Solibacter sp.]